jgi:hypothetical protein
MGEMNGNGHHEPAAPAAMNVTPEQQAQIKALNDLNGPVRQVVGTVIRGLLVSCPNVPPHVILSVIAFQAGNLIADAIVADLSTQFQLRKGFKEAFADGIKAAQMRQPPGAPAAPMTAINLKG